ncbi:hypothetical protein N9W79_01490, partial [bacterium]|nr:hypothetical protein [bacterium]
AQELKDIGYGAEFFTNIDELQFVLKDRRATMILFSDYGDELVVEQMLLKFLKIPDVMSAKLVLDSYSGAPRIKDLAITGAFRDIIPYKMISKEWIERFLYSTSSKASYTKAPNLMLTVNMKAAASIPAKITKLGPGYLRVETKMDPEIGTKIGLRGQVIKALGVKKLSVKIKSKERKNLTYRFSQALELEWDVEDVNAGRLKSLMAKLQNLNRSARHRIFLVCQDTDIRASVFDQLKHTQHDIRTAISNKGMINDPKFFTPDLVIVENAFLQDENGQDFSEMCGNLQYGSTVIIVGETSHLEYFQNKFKRLIIQVVASEVDEKIEEWVSMLNDDNVKNPGMVLDIPFNHDFSSGEFMVPARVSKLHPKMGELRFPLCVGDFSLVELDVRSLTRVYGKKPVIKLASYTKMPLKKNKKANFNHKSVFYFADVGLVNRIKLNQWMAERFYEELEIHGGTYSKFEKPEMEIDEYYGNEPTPEKVAEKKKKAAGGAEKPGSYAMHASRSAARNKADSTPYVHKALAKKQPKYVSFLDMDIPYKQFHLVKNTLIVMLTIGLFALFFSYVAKPRLSKVGEGYSDQFTKFRKYFGEQRGEFERNRIKSGKSENLLGRDNEQSEDEN